MYSRKSSIVWLNASTYSFSQLRLVQFGEKDEACWPIFSQAFFPTRYMTVKVVQTQLSICDVR